MWDERLGTSPDELRIWLLSIRAIHVEWLGNNERCEAAAGAELQAVEEGGPNRGELQLVVLTGLPRSRYNFRPYTLSRCQVRSCRVSKCASMSKKVPFPIFFEFFSHVPTGRLTLVRLASRMKSWYGVSTFTSLTPTPLPID